MNKFLAYTWLAALSLTGMAASAENSHFLDVWAGGGYDALLHGMEHTRVPGGGGFHVGAGYELNAGNFLLQTGAEFQWLSSRTRLSGYAEDYPILYDDGVEQSNLLYHYNFLEYTERHRAGYVNVPVMVGWKFGRYYALVGTKIGLNVMGTYASEGRVQPTVTEPAAIEDFTTIYDPVPMSNAGALDLGLNVTASAEVGVALDEWLPRGMTRLANRRRTPVSYRAALFVDYGLTDANRAPAFSPLVRPLADAQGVVADPLALAYAHLPASTLAEGNPLHNLYAGVKLTVQFDLTKKRRKSSRPVAEPMPFYARVTDAETQAALAGVEVTARLGSRVAFQQTTGADGMVAQPDVRRGRYTLSVAEDGYQAWRRTVSHYRPDTVEIALQRTPALWVRVYDADTRSPLPARVQLTRASDGQAAFSGTADAAGHLACDVRPGRYQAYVDAEGYIYQQSLIDFARTDTVAFALQPIRKDVRVVLHNLFFALNSAEMLPESAPALDDLHQFLVQNPEVRIRIVGHTDSTGSLEYNMRLSRDRARSVYDALLERGIAADRLTYEGKGPNEPVAGNDTEEGRAANRRVEFVIQ